MASVKFRFFANRFAGFPHLCHRNPRVYADPVLYIMQRGGTEAQTGLVYVLNNLGNQRSGTSTKTKRINQKFAPVAWDGHDATQPDERTTDDQGNSESPAPPSGYCVYAPIAD